MAQRKLTTLTLSGEILVDDLDDTLCEHGEPQGGWSCPECRQLLAEGRWDPGAFSVGAELRETRELWNEDDERVAKSGRAGKRRLH